MHNIVFWGKCCELLVPLQVDLNVTFSDHEDSQDTAEAADTLEDVKPGLVGGAGAGVASYPGMLRLIHPGMYRHYHPYLHIHSLHPYFSSLYTQK